MVFSDWQNNKIRIDVVKMLNRAQIGGTMIDNKELTQFTLADVIERKIHFTKTNTIFDKTDFKDNDEGEMLAYNEMLVDVKEMKENETCKKVPKYNKKT